jgi:isoleucyl-tRNA synthetase
MRFILANTAGFNPKTHQLNEDKILDLDKWIMSKTANLQIQILPCCYNLHQALDTILARKYCHFFHLAYSAKSLLL